MSDLAALLLSLNTLIVACACFILTFLIRRGVENAVPSAKKASDPNEPGLTYRTVFARWWNEFILYLLPVVIGSVFACLFSMGDSIAVSLVYGGVVGWFSAMLYKGVAQALKKKIGLDLAAMTASTPPPAMGKVKLTPQVPPQVPASMAPPAPKAEDLEFGADEEDEPTPAR